MPPEELHNRIYRLRSLIGDKDREHQIIVNRRGVGYVIDLPPSAVQVIEGVLEPAPTAPAEISLDEPDAAEPDQEGETDSSVPSVTVRLRPRLQTLVVTALVAIVALGGSWIAGYLLSPRDEVVADEPSGEAPGPTDKEEDDSGSGRDGTRKRHPEEEGRDQASGTASGSGSTAVDASGDSSDTTTQQEDSKDSKGDKEDPPPPPQPDASLYHLYNPDSGDHFMTTSSSVANQKQAQGYTSTLEGKAFSSQQKGTIALALDSGTAYVYKSRDSVPAGVSVTELYRLSIDGDYFYTASSSVANQAEAQGWTRSSAGYVQ